MPDLLIRPFTDDDYPTIAEIDQSCYPEYADTAETLRHRDSVNPPHIQWNHYLAIVDGNAVGVGYYFQRASAYHPQKFSVGVTVKPEWQRRGIGSALYERLLQELAPFDPILLRSYAQEGRMGGPEFLVKRGFTESMRNWESRLRLADFDPDAYKETLDKVAAQGIVIKPLSEVMTMGGWERKLFEMDWEITLDMPTTDVRTKPTFEHWFQRRMTSPDLLPDGWFIALDGDRFVGESELAKSELSTGLFVGSTGVLREYRRRGIATALKARATTFAKHYGADELKTWNAQSNRAMLSINEAMGFVKQPAWIEFEKTL